MKAFARNPKVREVFSARHIAVVGAGSLGSSLANMAARAGVGALTLIDPDRFSEENLARHMLDATCVGEYKVLALSQQLLAINPELKVTALPEKFDTIPQRPDVVLAATDSYQCSSRINSYVLRENVPAVFASVWGPAKVAEALLVIPGRTPCYECYASFRAAEQEIPDDPGPVRDGHRETAGTPSLRAYRYHPRDVRHHRGEGIGQGGVQDMEAGQDDQHPACG